MTIYKRISGNQRMRLKPNVLQDSGLITISNSLPTQVALTGLGERVSEHLGAIEDALTETVECDPVVGFTMNAAGGDGVFQGHSVIALSDQVGPPMLGRGADA